MRPEVRRDPCSAAALLHYAVEIFQLLGMYRAMIFFEIFGGDLCFVGASDALADTYQRRTVRDQL